MHNVPTIFPHIDLKGLPISDLPLASVDCMKKNADFIFIIIQVSRARGGHLISLHLMIFEFHLSPLGYSQVEFTNLAFNNYPGAIGLALISSPASRLL